MRNITDVLSFTLICRIVGFFREIVIASYLGATPEADAYSIAYSIPTVVVELLAFGAVRSAAMPVFQEVLQKDGKQRFQQLYNRVSTGILALLVVILVVCEVGSMGLTKIMAPSFSTEKLEMTNSMVKMMLPTIIFVGVHGLQKAALNLYGDFRSEGLSNVVFNCVLVAGASCAMWLQRMDVLIHSFLVAALIQWLIQYIGIHRTGLRTGVDFHLCDPEVKNIIGLLIPIMVSSIVSQLSPTAARAVASMCEDGTVARLNYAYKIFKLPIGIFSAAVATATFPRILRYVAEKSPKLQPLSAGVFRLILILFLPMVGILLGGSEPVVNILFERGVFTATDTQETAKMLCAYAPAMLFFAQVQILNNQFYAHKRAKEPIVINCASVIGSIVLAVITAKIWGGWAIPMSISVGYMINAFVLAVKVNRFNPGMTTLSRKELVFCGSAVAVIGIVMSGVSMLYKSWFYESMLLLRLGFFGLCCCAVMAVYGAFVYKRNVLGIREAIRLFREKDVAKTSKE